MDSSRLLAARNDASASPPRKRRTLWAVIAAVLALVIAGLGAPAAFASSVTTAVFSGQTGVFAVVGGTLYAKSSATLSLAVSTSSDTRCVDVTGALTAGDRSPSDKSQWMFSSLAAGAIEGVRTVTVAASPGINPQNQCTGQTRTLDASYVVDNTGPTLTATVSPAPNAAGWNNANATVTWAASDGLNGSGVATGPSPASATVSGNGISTPTSTATDRLGNVGNGAVTVRVDKTAPTITASQVQNADGTTTITFICSDTTSGVASCLAEGSTTNSRTVGPNTTVTGTATDAAGNTATASSTSPAGDTSAPILSGSPTTQPNPAGWYQGDVVIDWTASDAESGVPTQPSDTTITGEGTALTSTQSVTNGAGLSTTATSPAVKIDRTAPTTGISGASNGWVNGAVTVVLTPGDNLSGVARTEYTVDGGAVQQGTTFSLSTEGAHTITYRSVDAAGNEEGFHTATVNIDKTAPTIGHVFDPDTYTGAGWINTDVTVSFTCEDQGGSRLADCSADVIVADEGEQNVVGTATDNAGNSANDTATVRVDKTAPTIAATVGGTKNDAGWYNEDVTVSFSAEDALSGIASLSPAAVLSDGAGQTASGTATDAAGNSASTTVTGINVDTTAPVLTAEYSTAWSAGDVTVVWTCTDEGGSGVGDAPGTRVVDGEGANLSDTASCIDVAGNTATETASGIRIDRTAPVTTASLADAGDDGWHSAAVEVTLTGNDNLSGVASTLYTVDGGAAQEYSGVFSITADGEHTVTFWSKDAAGNVEQAGPAIEVKVDTTAPTTAVINPISPASGWFVTSGIPFAFDASDEHSGVAATYYTIDGGDPQLYGEEFTENLSTGTHEVTYWSVDIAGNIEVVQSLTINVDTVLPTITGQAIPAANAFGWNNDDVTVKFTCSDAESDIAGCAPDVLLENEGAGQTAAGQARDNAGNLNSTTVGPVNIDKTKPTLAGVLPAANGAGWYRDDVTVQWQGDDGLSGIDPASQPTASIITGEGDDLGAGPVTIDDKAGNTSDPASVTGVKIDRTAPEIEGNPSTAPNAAGWYNSSVIVDFTCTDNLSGVAQCPTSKVVSGDGANKSATSGSAGDEAGNEAAGITVEGINIDGTAPTTLSDNTCTKVNGWCTAATAGVVLTATDQAGLSGVKEIWYAVNGGAPQRAAGASATATVPLTGTGSGTVSYYAVDHAGNAESPNTVSLKWDNIAPTVKHTLSPAPNADEWNMADVTVSFTAKDDDAGSGVSSVSEPVLVSEETAGQVVTGTATDTAGNVGTDSVTVKLDKTAPTITTAITAGQLGANGWYTGPVTVTFTCADALSGVATCPDPQVLTSNGLNTPAGAVTDKAGNTASAVLGGIRIDQEKPTLTAAGVNVAGGIYVLGSAPAATCTATDNVSGLASCVVSVTGGTANGVGTFSYTATATDNAGNQTILTGSYTVTYRFDGFLQPINDTAHQVGVSTSIFKAGSTVPVKFQLKDAAGKVVQSATAPVWLTPVKGSATSAPVDETSYPATADSGTAYRYDATAQQYIYNWKTGNGGGNYWRIGLKLDDGQTYYVNIGLR
ncbi:MULTISPECIES: OmpL47-type beta-barrel domain-containing protein [unclassified Microbacterium]|uniref:OmpL47-type beta-barrel domain-containing protein n=1 Tax=unclassified Microbacterium TaxID=2609290 RepID=UPI00300FC119